MGAKSTQEGVAGERSGPEAGRMQGHWLLAKLGKRILRPGGRALTAKLLEQAKPARKELSRVIKVGARPLTLEGWTELLAAHGLGAEWHDRAPLHLLEPRRIVSDEGLWGALRFWNNARRIPGARDRLKAMRQGFQFQGKLMGGIVILARKPGAASL